MWDTPFDTSMLSEGNVIILCPDEALSKELMEVLAENGVVWGGDETPEKSNSRWYEYEDKTCYWVENKRLSYGDIDYAESDEDGDYNNHTKCTFYGTDMPDFDAATDEELCSFLGT